MPTVISAKFEDLVAVGLKALISEDPNLDLVAADVPMDELTKRIAEHQPAVARSPRGVGMDRAGDGI